jgi:hypothetical protein
LRSFGPHEMKCIGGRASCRDISIS